MRNIVIGALVVLSLVLAVHAQEAAVIVIDPQDAKKAASLYQAKLDAERDWEQFSDRMKDKYATMDSTYQMRDGKPERVPREGWSYGIQFSKDFKALIPAQYKVAPCSQSLQFQNAPYVISPAWNYAN